MLMVGKGRGRGNAFGVNGNHLFGNQQRTYFKISKYIFQNYIVFLQKLTHKHAEKKFKVVNFLKMEIPKIITFNHFQTSFCNYHKKIVGYIFYNM